MQHHHVLGFGIRRNARHGHRQLSALVRAPVCAVKILPPQLRILFIRPKLRLVYLASDAVCC